MSANKTRRPIIKMSEERKQKTREEIDDLILQFLEYLEIERGASSYTIRNYFHYLNRFKDWFKNYKKNVSIKDINLEIIRKYRVYLSRYSDATRGPISRATQSYHIIAIRSFLKWLIKNDFEVLSPEKIELPKTESRRISFLNREQVERLLQQPSISTNKGLRDKAILETFFSTGLRVSELVSLDRDQVDLKRREFGVTGKGGRIRVVFLSKRACDWLGKYLLKRNDKWKPLFINYVKRKDDAFKSDRETRLTPRSVQRLVRGYARKAKLPINITPHVLRHSFATDLLHSGAGLREVQEMLGHKNVATTQIYTHVTNPQLRKVHERFHSGNK